MKDREVGKKIREQCAPLNLTSEEFRRVGHDLVDRIASFYESLPERPVTTGKSPNAIRQLFQQTELPNRGSPPQQLLEEIAQLLFNHGLHNGHPRFWGYITSSAAPIGALADLLAAAANPNVGAWQLSPVASEIEGQTVKWIAEMIGYPQTCGGLMVSGGNMANFIGFFAARAAKTPWNMREGGLNGGSHRLAVYASKETHTWIQKAADLSGIGTNAIRWVDTDDQQRIDIACLEQMIVADKKQGVLPLMAVAAAGSVSTGVVDPLADMAAICEKHNLWFHVDGAYGAPAAVLPELAEIFAGIERADSIALDPHKWLYAPLEAGCALVRTPKLLSHAFAFNPAYYQFEDADEEAGTNYYACGLQNSRGFRALKVWLGLRQVGRDGYVEMIRDDIALAQRLFEGVDAHSELEAKTMHLSIATFRYVPSELMARSREAISYLNDLNKALLAQLQAEGEAFVSNALINDRYYLRACIVNFRTTVEDVDALPGIVARIGRSLDEQMRPASLPR